ncbi:hypothetical protein CALCODRAFT_487425 [Calocera cornea HHB12733]|uniref:RRM domain-containing protein n=1 Tax=Calocera cornea HHB12733 TaxID=1353952 RepID=A0A165D4D1_9BASI|nr:hypothetical protein CALCODRAFT_487425 [Calocera cornea HHB12733]
MNDTKVFVGQHIPRKARQSKIDEMKSQFTNLYVKNLDTEVTDGEFYELLAPFGNITSAEDHEDAQRAVEDLNNKQVNGKPISFGRAQKKSERRDELRKQYEQAKYEKAGKYQ